MKTWLKKENIRRFWTKVLIRGRLQCWLWKPCKGRRIYGQFSAEYKGFGAHVYSLMIRLGRPLRRGEFSLHKCDEPACVNPRHLFLGDSQENMDDMMRKGRHRTSLGQDHGMAKLDEIDVIDLRGMYATGRYSQRKLADIFDISQGGVGLIVLRKRWTHV